MASVLIVEADPGIRMFHQIIYRDAGHRVTCVGRAEQALDMLATNRFDLAIVGGLPDEAHGIALMRKRREDGIATRTRVVFHTDDRLAAELELGDMEAEFVDKPANSWQLLALTRLGSGLELV